jgi:hypothetical protein
MFTFTAAFGICLAVYRWGCGGNRQLWDIAWEVQRGEELAPYLEASRRRHKAKQVLAAEVVAGRMALREAAGHFRRLEEDDPAYPPGTSLPPHEEWFFCEGVLDYVWVVLADQQRYAAAARYYAEAFRAAPRFLAEPLGHHRYRAACASARAGCGQGRDAAKLDETSRARFRRQARDWLRDELEARRQLVEREPERHAAFTEPPDAKWRWTS